MEGGCTRSVTQFVGREYIDLNIYGNAPFHSMGLIKVTSLPPASSDDAIVNRVKLKALDKAKILKAAEVKILPGNRQEYIPSSFFLLLSSILFCDATSTAPLSGLGSRVGDQSPLSSSTPTGMAG